MLAMQGRLLLVNYHYVRDPKVYAYPGIHPLSPEQLRRQVGKLGSTLELLTPGEAEAYLLGRRPLDRPSALLTFDDGLVDHAWAAREILDPLHIKAVFFVCTRPLVEERALVVHKVHYLRATTEPEQFRREFLELLPGEWQGSELSSEQREAARRTYIYDRPEHGDLKYLINFVLPEHVVDAVTTGMFEGHEIDEAEFCRRTYMDANALRALEASGHRVEAHTHDHRPVTTLGPDESELMTRNVDVLTQVLGRRPTWISFPYGRDWALQPDPAAFCRRYGFQIGITLTGDWVRPEHRPYAVDRINTNEVDMVLAQVAEAGG
ncbi:MAG TPA: polysaccharide deacetylase family protein [Devosiaceae bacterium]|jgi:peptidoglycan/xylan/chitin deacetylase (PgdA/CDA1 family)|nr:polysaccharide deacetylase family protein [Devosiaceae bacterium]